ncbi:MAG: hypothetical protein KAG66_03525 [Methylococcales bacterium]|nr:hypothetical protein [Methylococcales bacterium]
MQASCFQNVALGIVAENKAMKDASGKFNRTILVTDIESLNMTNGEIRSNPEQLESSGVDATGKVYNSAVVVDQVIEATWVPFLSNRLTAPDVRRGERVRLWRSGDADKYYWSTMGLDENLRKLETVIFAFSGTQDESQTELDLENCYYFEVSTHNKSITLQTSASNGEPFRYTAQINAAEGALLIEDDVGNSFELDSTENRLTLENADDSKVELNRGKIAIVANEEVSLTVGGTKQVWKPNITTLKTPKFAGGS